MNIRTLAEKLAIDKNNLDAELALQPNLYFEGAMEAARAKEVREQCKVELDLLIDEVIEEIRAGDTKIAENRVKREADADPNVVDKRRALIRLQREEAEWNSLVRAVEQRSNNLSSLSRLYAGSYFVRDTARHGGTQRRRVANGT